MKRILIILLAVVFLTTVFKIVPIDDGNHVTSHIQGEEQANVIVLSEKITELTGGLSAVRHIGDYGFDEFLEQGGASSDAEVVSFLLESGIADFGTLLFGGNPFGCSTLAVKDENGNALFGRNFDWNTCHAMIIQNVPKNGYASISTVNMDFITVSGLRLSLLPDEIQALAGLYAPLDGLNEMGLAVSVNMIQDNTTIEQNTDKPDVTTTTAVRLLLDQAADVEEAIELLNSYDLHASFGYMVHFAIADQSGRSVVVEYVNNEMLVTETPAVTNFYLSEGEKNGIGTQQSHERYELLINRLKDSETMEMNDVRDALDSVSKDNFGEFEATEWSIVMNQTTGEVRYYHREDYNTAYTFMVTGGQES
ncbi:MAG: linear amide C-N hydrolase [Dorea sp.]|uniref:linear amide C-N hydrolase n=1 Tax=Sporofaciens musculi TaxID=2681861 RepID=UPI002171E447|nr:C45 family peptidase [Sporofaciens musculi]MCI9421876.1 linear amide C-N hydrolase [Dorea sp.]